jgi:hypothetical protein
MSNSENIVFKFDAQTAQAIASLTKLQASMGGIGDAATKAEQKTNVGLDKITAGLIKFQGVMFAAEKGVQLLGKALEFGKFSEDMEKLQKVVSSDLVESVQRATSGVVSQTDIMRSAAKALTGDMKLTEAQITDVFKAAKVLSDRGFGDTAENAEKLFTSLRKGTSEALKEFGLAVQDGKTGAEKFSNAMAAIKSTASTLPNGLNSTTDATQRLTASLSNLADTIKMAVGGVVADLADGLSGLIDKVNELTDLSGGRSKLGRSAGMASIRVADEMKQKWGTDFSPSDVYAIAAGQKGASKEHREYIQKRFAEFEAPPSDPYAEADKAGAGFVTFAKQPSASRGSSSRRAAQGPTLERDSDRLSDAGDWSKSDTFGTGLGSLSAGTARQSSLGDLFPSTGGAKSASGFGAGFSSGLGDVRKEMVSLQEFGADAADITKNAINASLQAAISGQMSMAKATRAALAQGLGNKAIVWGFEGSAMLLTGNPKGIALIALAAAAGIAARAMGGGASGTPAAKPGGGYAGAGMGGGFGGQGYSGPQSVSFYTQGRGEKSVVQFDRQYREAKARGYIPATDGPARLVG